MRHISPDEANTKMKANEIIILDVREQFEIEASAVSDYLHMPMQQIPSRLDEIPKNKDVAVLCHTGSRSARVTQYLMQMGFDNIMNIEGGIERWSIETDPGVPRYRKAFGRAQIINQ